MTHLRTDHLPLIHRVSMDRPHHQIGLADRPPEPFIVPRMPAKVRTPSNPIRDFMLVWATVSVIRERVAEFFRPVNALFAYLDSEYQAARAALAVAASRLAQL